MQHILLQYTYEPLGGRVDRATATETVDTGCNPCRVKLMTIKISIHSFPAWRSALKKGQCETSTMGGRQVGTGLVTALLEDRKVPLLSPGRGNLVNKHAYTIITILVYAGMWPIWDPKKRH